VDLPELFASAVPAKIAGFFHGHPASIETAHGVATWVGLPLGDVEPALEALVTAKVLMAHRSGAMTGYSLTSDGAVVRRVKRLLDRRGD